jgi:hypothetical protein
MRRLNRGGSWALGRGRVQKQVVWAFAITGRSVMTTGELLNWTHAPLPRAWTKSMHHYGDVRRACARVAVRVGRGCGKGSGKGRPVRWRLRPEYARQGIMNPATGRPWKYGGGSSAS